MRQADKLKILVMCYWRFIHSCPVIAQEAYGADVLAINPRGMIIETEVKTNIADLRRDVRKPKHRLMNHCHYFYFATPPGLVEKALPLIRERYPYAGLPSVSGKKVVDYDHRDITLYRPEVEIVREAQRRNRPKMETKEMMKIMKAQSATLCRMAYKQGGGRCRY